MIYFDAWTLQLYFAFLSCDVTHGTPLKVSTLMVSTLKVFLWWYVSLSTFICLQSCCQELRSFKQRTQTPNSENDSNNHCFFKPLGAVDLCPIWKETRPVLAAGCADAWDDKMKETRFSISNQLYSIYPCNCLLGARLAPNSAKPSQKLDTKMPLTWRKDERIWNTWKGWAQSGVQGDIPTNALGISWSESLSQSKSLSLCQLRYPSKDRWGGCIKVFYSPMNSSLLYGTFTRALGPSTSNLVLNVLLSFGIRILDIQRCKLIPLVCGQTYVKKLFRSAFMATMYQ